MVLLFMCFRCSIFGVCFVCSFGVGFNLDFVLCFADYVVFVCMVAFCFLFLICFALMVACTRGVFGCRYFSCLFLLPCLLWICLLCCYVYVGGLDFSGCCLLRCLFVVFSVVWLCWLLFGYLCLLVLFVFGIVQMFHVRCFVMFVASSLVVVAVCGFGSCLDLC